MQRYTKSSILPNKILKFPLQNPQILLTKSSISIIIQQFKARNLTKIDKLEKTKKKNNFFKEIILKSKGNNKKIKEFFCVLKTIKHKKKGVETAFNSFGKIKGLYHQ